MRRRILKWGLLLAAAIGGFILFSGFFYWLVPVSSRSMMNSILPGERLLASRSVGKISRGDIVVFKFSKDTTTRYVSRVVGLAGETLLIRGGEVLINGQPIPEKRVAVESSGPDSAADSAELTTVSDEGEGPYTVYYGAKDRSVPGTSELPTGFGVNTPFEIPAGYCFMIADNRDSGEDSRVYGPVPEDLIVAKPVLIYWSVDPKTHEIRFDRFLRRPR